MLQLQLHVAVLLQMIRRLGKEINHPDSIYYWAYKNDIPVYCPALTDGSLGDMLYFHTFKNPGLILDIIADIRSMNDEAMKAPPRKTGVIILGGGIQLQLAVSSCYPSVPARFWQCCLTPSALCTNGSSYILFHAFQWVAICHNVWQHVMTPDECPCRPGKASRLQCQPHEEWGRLCGVYQHSSGV